MMKIVVGLGSIDEYIPFVEAGADEFFCGFVPDLWNEKYGTLGSLNRREVRNVNVQLGAMEELKILKNMMDVYGVPVKLTFNSLYYTGSQYEEIAEIIELCMSAGFDTFIIADPALVLYLRTHHQGGSTLENVSRCRIHLSGEMSELNTPFIKDMAEYDIARVIFHRKMCAQEMKFCIAQCKKQVPEYEAFLLNEMCHFTGAYCNSLHCDELGHLCHVPYELGSLDGKMGKRTSVVQEADDVADNLAYETGSTGCGLCALYDLEAAGVTHLKVVGRGNYTDFMKRDIMQVRKALQILEEIHEQGGDQTDFKNRIQKELFTGKCSGNCYYR